MRNTFNVAGERGFVEMPKGDDGEYRVFFGGFGNVPASALVDGPVKAEVDRIIAGAEAQP